MRGTHRNKYDTTTPYDEMIDVDKIPPNPTGAHVYHTAVMGSLAHTYGNVLAFIENWVLDLFPKDYFKTIHINSKLAHRQMIDTDVRAMGKKINPKIIFRPRFADPNEDRFLKGTWLAEKMTNDMYTWGGTNLQGFFIDNQKGYEIRYQMNRSVLYIDVVCVFNSMIQQINMQNYLLNRWPIGHPGKLPTCLENFIPYSLINAMSMLSDIPVVDKNGCTKAFMDYLNGHSKYPITYKLSGENGNREFYRYYPVNVEVLVSDLDGNDEGEKVGQVMGSYQLRFTIRTEFETTGFFHLFGYELDKRCVPNIDDLDTFQEDDVIPVFTDITMKEDYNIKPGWSLYNQATCRLEDINDHINITELMNTSILKAIEFYHRNGIPCVEFLDIRVRRQGILLTEGKDYVIDYNTMDVQFHNDSIYFTYKFLIYINVQMINEVIKAVYKLE